MSHRVDKTLLDGSPLAFVVRGLGLRAPLDSTTRTMKQKPRRSRISQSVPDPNDEIILLEDLAPRGDVKGGMIVFGAGEQSHTGTAREMADDARMRHPLKPQR